MRHDIMKPIALLLTEEIQISSSKLCWPIVGLIPKTTVLMFIVVKEHVAQGKGVFHSF